MDLTPILITAVPILIVGVVAWSQSKSPYKKRIKSWLFSENPEDISLRSADNLRILSEDQLKAYEEEGEKGEEK